MDAVSHVLQRAGVGGLTCVQHSTRQLMNRLLPPFPSALGPRSDHEEKCDLQNYRIKAQNTKKKQEILSSLYKELVLVA